MDPTFIERVIEEVMVSLHFMPESAIHMKDKTEINIDLGAERVRATIAGMHPGIHDPTTRKELTRAPFGDHCRNASGNT